MSDPDPLRTIHFRVARAGARLLRVKDERGGGPPGASLTAWVARQNTPEQRATYVEWVDYGWVTIAGAICLAMLVLGFAVREIAGRDAADVVIIAAQGPAWFCLAGCANVTWRRYWFVPQARRHLRAHGADDERFARSMRKALPRDSSLIFQLAVGVLASVVAAAALS